MKFELYDDVKPNKEVEALAACGIHEGRYGTVTRIEGEKSLVLFYDSEDTGDSAWVWTENENLEFFQK